MVTQPLKFDDAKKLLSVSDKRDRMLFACGLYMGLRGSSELCSLKWGDLVGKNFIHVYQPKTKKTRPIVISNNLKKHIDECYDGQPLGSYVFTGRRGQFGNNPLTNAGLNKIIRKWVRILGIEPRGNDTSHMLRKTFGRNYYERNGRTFEALKFLQEQFGHANPNITAIYIGVNFDEQAQRVQNVSYE